MNDTFSVRLRAAVVAGWWTLLIWALWLTVAWVIWLVLLYTQPGWLLQLWGGGDLNWSQVQLLVLCFVAAMKGLMLVFLMALICLTLWLRRLGRPGGSRQ